MKTISFFLSICTMIFYGCSNNSSNPTAAGVGGVGVTAGGTAMETAAVHKMLHLQ
jgi:hypothetical protein